MLLLLRFISGRSQSLEQPFYGSIIDWGSSFASVQIVVPWFAVKQYILNFEVFLLDRNTKKRIEFCIGAMCSINHKGRN